MDHRKLCEVGAKFLKRPLSANGHGCHFALIEPAAYGENPDVIGYRHGYDGGTVLLEAKTSRSDFLRDRKKPHRENPEQGIGRWRYYICPTDVIKPKDLPPKWGLIHVNERGHCKVIAGAMAVPFKTDINPSGSKVRYRSFIDLDHSLKAHAFDARNTDNEINILVMALARLEDPEQALYAQRHLLRVQNELIDLRRETSMQEHKISNLQRKIRYYQEKLQHIDKIKQQLMDDPDFHPVCGNAMCIFHHPEIEYHPATGFRCLCGWQLPVDQTFIDEYLKKHEQMFN